MSEEGGTVVHERRGPPPPAAKEPEAPEATEDEAPQEDAEATAAKQAKMDEDKKNRRVGHGFVTQTLDNALAGGPALAAEKQAARDAEAASAEE